MAPLKSKGDLAEVMVAADLMRRGYKIAFPYGEDWDYDLVVDRGLEKLERVQVKHAQSNGEILILHAYSHSLTNGKIRATKRYTADNIDWLAAYDPVTNCCYYVPAVELGTGRSALTLRFSAPKNNQRLGIRLAASYVEI